MSREGPGTADAKHISLAVPHPVYGHPSLSRLVRLRFLHVHFAHELDSERDAASWDQLARSVCTFLLSVPTPHEVAVVLTHPIPPSRCQRTPHAVRNGEHESHYIISQHFRRLSREFRDVQIVLSPPVSRDSEVGAPTMKEGNHELFSTL